MGMAGEDGVKLVSDAIHSNHFRDALGIYN